MTMTEQDTRNAAYRRRRGPRISRRRVRPPNRPPQKKPTVLDQMGGPMGMVWSTVPVVVFVAANSFVSLSMAIGVAVASGWGSPGSGCCAGSASRRRSASLVGVAGRRGNRRGGPGRQRTSS